jgi:Domain of unknown function (DUF4382)
MQSMSNTIFRAFRPLLAGLSLSVATLGALGACSDTPTEVRSTRLSVLLTDAPGDVRAAVVTIDRIYLQPGEDGIDGRMILREEDITTDLLTLVDSTLSLVDSALVPQGNYRQLRFVISGGYLEVENADGSSSIYASSPTYAGLPVGAVVAGELQMPSFAQSGLKVNLPNDQVVFDEDEFWLLIDFDVSQSFGQQAGGSGRWVMSPVIQATRVTPPEAPAP